MIKTNTSLLSSSVIAFPRISAAVSSSRYCASSSSTNFLRIHHHHHQQYRNFKQLNSLVRNQTSSSPSSGADLLITEACGKRIKDINEKKGQLDRMLRVIVESGGCSGYQVEFTFSKQVEQDDQVFTNTTYPESKVIADSITMSFIKGSTIDFVESMAKTAFVLEKNPNAETGCSCGTSFSVKSKE